MRIIQKEEITKAVRKLYIEENYFVRQDYKNALKSSLEIEISPLAKEIVSRMLKNYEIAEIERIPMCQDTGYAVFFVQIGQDVHIDGNIYESINQGVREACMEGLLRASIVQDPLIRRKNTGDNTPAVVHIEFVPGDKVKITAFAKGGGSENKGRLYMLKPNDGIEGLKKAVIETVLLAGPDACPPFVVGVGIGGTFDKVPELAKKALIREIGSIHPEPEFGKLEKELLEEVNKLNVGPQGLGGKTTALAVFIEFYPCHIASLPVAINIQCNANRVMSVEI